MKKGWLALGFLLTILTVNAQKPNIDSLRQILRTTKVDTVKVKALNHIGYAYLNNNNDSTISYELQAISLSQKINDQKELGIAYLIIGSVFQQQNNQPKALEYGYKALQIGERIKDDRITAYGYNQLGTVIGGLQQNHQEAIQHYKKAYRFVEQDTHNSFLPEDKPHFLNNIGSTYLRLKMPDSALQYYQAAYQSAINQNINSSFTLAGLAKTHFMLNNAELGKAYSKTALGKATNIGQKASVYSVLGEFFQQAGNTDSALYYTSNAAKVRESLKDKVILLQLYSKLAILFQQQGNKDSTLLYQGKLLALKDSVEAQNNVAQIQSLTFAEQLRQQEIISAEAKAKEEHEHNLQYAAIALSMVALLISFLVLSHSVLANQKLIRFLGVISLLIVFEFLNLLLHPWLGDVTHHSPVLMLLAMVCLAALLVPMHHRLEHWITHKLVEKNNRIRLAAAKRTIQQLEGSPEVVTLSNGSGTE